MRKRAIDEMIQYVPEEFREKANGQWDKTHTTFYVFRLTSTYSSEKKYGITKRRQLGSIKDGVWRTSPTYLKLQEIERLKAQVEADNPIKEKLEKPEIKQVVEKVREEASRTVEDPRSGVAIYSLEIILCVMVLASLGGFTSAASVAAYWQRFRYELEIIFNGDFPARDISHDTLNRIMRVINPEHHARFLTMFTFDTLRDAEERMVHIDGQVVGASKDEEMKKGRNFLNVFESTSRLFMGQKLVGAKRNEIPACLEIVECLDLRPGDIVTTDALNTQKALVSLLNSKGAGWVLALKRNHPSLFDAVRELFKTTDEAVMQLHKEDDCVGGRATTRITRTLPGHLLPGELLELWPGLRNGSIAMSVSNTEKKGGINKNSKSSETRYFISSIPFDREDNACKNATVIRRHWAVESFHWLVDVVMDQDRIQSTDSNYLLMRTATNKLAISLLAMIQNGLWKETGKKISLNLLKESCSTPLSCLEFMAKYVLK